MRPESKAPKSKPPRVGHCGAIRCTCLAFAPGRMIDTWITCAACKHTQAVHARMEQTA